MLAPLQTTLADIVELLESRQIQYALVGGLATSLRGQPRVTADVDLVIRVDVPAALNLASSLSATSFEPLFAGVDDVIERAFILPLRHRTTGVKVDLALALSGFEGQLIDRAERVMIAATATFVATAEDLMIMKVLPGRPQDDQDLRGLVMAQGESLNWEYCLETARELGDAIGQDLESKIRALRSAEDGQ